MITEPIIGSDRDRRVWRWIVAQVGEEAALAVELAGNRKPYPSNIAKALGLQVPVVLTQPGIDVARERIQNLKRILGRKT